MVSELQPGDPQTIGPYRLVGWLGQGGLGQVYLGVSPDGQQVAVKVIRGELAADPQFRVRFGREVAAARRVSGVFTAMVVDADADGPVAWLATVYVPGPSLAEAVDSRGPLPERSLPGLLAGLAESLTAIHAAGVVHGDLQPSNVLLAEDGPRVVDFGISRAAESTALAQAGPVIGSPGFMSPEQAAGGEVDRPSDVFSLGAVLAFAATGEEPFGTGTTAALLYRVVHESPSLDRVPSTVRPLIERCLAKDPAQRPTAAGLQAETGALPADADARQPTGNWLPASVIRSFSREVVPGAAFVPSAPALAAVGTGSTMVLPDSLDLTSRSLPPPPGDASHQPGSGAPTGPQPVATQTALAAYAARVSAPADYSPTVSPGSLPPPGDAPGQPSPRSGNRPRRRLGLPLVLACVLGVLLVTSAFALTSVSGKTSTAQDRSAAAPSPTALTSAGPTSSGKSASPSPSERVSSQAVVVPAAGPAQQASASASPSVRKSSSPKPSASRSTPPVTPSTTPPTTPSTTPPTTPSTPPTTPA